MCRSDEADLYKICISVVSDNVKFISISMCLCFTTGKSIFFVEERRTSTPLIKVYMNWDREGYYTLTRFFERHLVL